MSELIKQCLAGAAILLERCTWKGILYLLYYQYTFWEIFWPLCTSEQRGMCFDWVMIAFIFSGIIGKTIVNTWAWTIPSSREVLSWNIAGPFLSQHFVCAPVCVCAHTQTLLVRSGIFYSLFSSDCLFPGAQFLGSAVFALVITQ